MPGGNSGMTYRIVSFFALILWLCSVMTFKVVDAQEEKVSIVNYAHGACVVDGQRFRPQFAEDGLVSQTLPSSYWNCEDVINSGILNCERAIRHIYSFDDEKFPACLKIFESWVPLCIAHYENQRGRCETALKAHKDRSQPSRNESSDCKFARKTFEGYQSACNDGNSNACGVLTQAEAIVKDTCR